MVLNMVQIFVFLPISVFFTAVMCYGRVSLILFFTTLSDFAQRTRAKLSLFRKDFCLPKTNCQCYCQFPKRKRFQTCRLQNHDLQKKIDYPTYLRLELTELGVSNCRFPNKGSYLIRRRNTSKNDKRIFICITRPKFVSG